MIGSFLSQLTEQKSKRINILIAFVIVLISAIGIGLLYSAGEGSFNPWAFRQFLRILVGLGVMALFAFVPLKWWFHSAYVIYIVSLLLVIGVEVMGFIGKVGHRWINLYIINIQPSELMKIAVILAISRYFHSINNGRPPYIYQLVIPFLLVIIPVLLICKQPDLGTAMILLLTSAGIVFLSGVSLWVFVVAIGGASASIPLLWIFLHDYQKKRILTFLHPEEDALGAGYHIMQSKIALGSGGLTGKGFMHGTQAYLNFLPEKQTDFIFTMLCEEFGFLGGVALIGLYTMILAYGAQVVFSATNLFSRLVASGITIMFFLHLFINIAMVMGLLPVVGIPLPLVSYGGTSLLTLMMGFGILFCIAGQRQVKLPRTHLNLI